MGDLLGKKLLNYRIEKLLGQGGMGEAYLGVHTEIERKVAIKVISPHLARDERIRERFRREALILSRLNHPNIVQLYDFWDRPEGLFLIMEYVDGISLDRYIHRVVRGPLPLRLAIDIFLQVLEAFQYAHQQGIIHRDIKPSNILIRKEQDYYSVKVLDFGIARILSGDTTQDGKQTELTKTGTTLGTIAYMSPEQIKAKTSADIDHRSDIYSLGIVFFEMLTGQPMYDRSELSEFDLLLKIAMEPPPSLLSVNPNLPPELDTILQKALAKSPKDRYQSCLEFAADLMRFSLQNKIETQTLSATSHPMNPALTQPTVVPGGRSPSLLQNTLIKLRNSLSLKTQTKPQKTAYLAGIIIALLALLLWGGISWYTGYRSKQQALQVARDFVEKALRQHDPVLLSTLLTDTLEYFFDKPQKTISEIKKGYMDFWQTLQSDSVSWVGDLSVSKHEGVWIVQGTLYYAYTTRPRKEVEYKKRYNKLRGRYDTYPETRIIPSQTICKMKTLQIAIKSSKILRITQLDENICR